MTIRKEQLVFNCRQLKRRKQVFATFTKNDMVYIQHNENSRPVLVTPFFKRYFLSFMFLMKLGKIKTYKDTKMYNYYHQSFFAKSLGVWWFMQLTIVCRISHIACGLYRGAGLRQDVTRALTHCCFYTNQCTSSADW